MKRSMSSNSFFGVTRAYAVVTNKMVSSDFRAISANLATMQKKVLDKKQEKVKKQQTAALRETA